MRSAGASESIVRAALLLFGERGVDATSLREVAKSADVSPALVVHHFSNKEGLVAAVDETALLEFDAAYKSEESTSSTSLLRHRAEQTARVMRKRPDLCAYLGRALVDGTPGSAGLFRLMVNGGRAEIKSLVEKGALREDTDRLWATLQHFFLIWAPLSFLPLLEQVLEEPLLSGESLSRWVEANIELLEKGLYR